MKSNKVIASKYFKSIKAISTKKINNDDFYDYIYREWINI